MRRCYDSDKHTVMKSYCYGLLLQEPLSIVTVAIHCSLINSRTSLLRSSIFQELQLNIMDIMGYVTKITGHLRKLTAQ